MSKNDGTLLVSRSVDDARRSTTVIRVFLGDLYPGVYLNRRESEYVFLLLQGKKRREIAANLQIGIRTLDSYIQTIKIKLRCQRARDILLCIRQTDFVKNIPLVLLMSINPRNSVNS